MVPFGNTPCAHDPTTHALLHVGTRRSRYNTLRRFAGRIRAPTLDTTLLLVPAPRHDSQAEYGHRYWIPPLQIMPAPGPGRIRVPGLDTTPPCCTRALFFSPVPSHHQGGLWTVVSRIFSSPILCVFMLYIYKIYLS